MDRIKKIKIKQQDGTMSDYYSIGVDASNVDIDYNNSTLEVTMKKTPRYYENVASMKLDDTLQEGDMAITLGYYTANDGGGAEYKIVDTSSKYYEELNNELLAELIIKNEMNLLHFGAKGDGITDDTQAIQNAINFCSLNYAILFIPKQVFCVSSLVYHSHLHLKGIDKSLSIIKRISTYNPMQYGNNYRFGSIIGNPDLITEELPYYEDIELSNFTIDGIKDIIYNAITDEAQFKTGTWNNIRIAKSKNVILENLIIKNAMEAGIYIAAGCINALIENSDIFNNGLNFSNYNKNGISISGSYWQDSTQSRIFVLNEKIRINNNNIYENTDEGIMYQGCKDIIIENNNIYNNLDRGIEGDSASFGQGAIELNIVIKNNYISANQNLAVSEYSYPHSMNYIFTGNIMKNTYGSILSIQGATSLSTDYSNILISNNIFDKNLDNANGLYIMGHNVTLSNNQIYNIKKGITLTGINSCNLINNIIHNDFANKVTTNYFLKSDNIINIKNNDFTNAFGKIVLQSLHSSTTNTIEHINITNNTIINCQRVIELNGTLVIKNAVITNNYVAKQVPSGEEDFNYDCFFGFNNDSAITFLLFTGNQEVGNRYGNGYNHITNVIRQNLDDRIYSIGKYSSTKPTTASSYCKKGMIVYSSTITVGSPLGWVFDGTEWLPFGEIMSSGTSI